MPLDLTMSVMSLAEFLLWAVLGFLFLKKGLHRRFRAMGTYLALRVFSMPVLLGLLYLQAQPWGHAYFPAYFYSYWAVYCASAITLFFVCVEVFRAALSGFSGLMRLGTVVFRWAAFVSLVVSLTTVSYSDIHMSAFVIPDVAIAITRAVSILVLCLLAFQTLSMNALHYSPRELSFGITLGFGLMAAGDFVVGTLLSRNSSLTSPVQFVNEAVILMTLGIWITYCALPEPAPKPMVMPVNSAIYRWNEIAAALGHGTQIAVQQPANGFFLSDVERVVDKVLTRNMQGSESKT
ncbi:MAG TPA: hypothetical protein VFI20_02675 [Terracidiphilus sp.]|nr:hypothetical protein [Terracidiphilus sp.]